MTDWADTALFGSWGEPTATAIYGDSGLGKSVDAVLTFPEAWILAPPGGTKGALEIVGTALYEQIKSRTVAVASISEATACVEAIAAGEWGERRPVIVDDGSILADAELEDMRATGKYPESHTFQLWRDLSSRVKRLRDACTEDAGVHTTWNFHARKASTSDKGKFTIGGPMIGGPSVTSPFVHTMHVVYRATTEPGRAPWPMVYTCANPDPDWAYKDRHGVVRGSAPGNLREILLAAGYTIPRPAGLEWLDEIADEIAADFDTPEKRHEVMRKWKAWGDASQLPDGFIYWPIRDGLDRADLRRRRGLLSLLQSNEPDAATAKTKRTLIRPVTR